MGGEGEGGRRIVLHAPPCHGRHSSGQPGEEIFGRHVLYSFSSVLVVRPSDPVSSCCYPGQRRGQRPCHTGRPWPRVSSLRWGVMMFVMPNLFLMRMRIKCSIQISLRCKCECSRNIANNRKNCKTLHMHANI